MHTYCTRVLPWERFKHTHQLYLESISYEQLAADKQLGGDRAYLQQRANDYALIVIDEAQAFRNPDTGRARALRKLLQGQPSKKLVLMTATPVNNSLWDLYYLLTYFIRHDAAFAELGVRSLKDRFTKAMQEDPDDLRPDLLFDILDATTVRRTRSFVIQYYPNDRVLGPGGVEMPIRFPKPHLESIGYSLDKVLPGFFDEFADAIMPDDGDPLLTLARYGPTNYKKDSPQSASEAALIGLLRSSLLKRFESSVHAFANTLDKLTRAHDVFLEGLDHGVILTAEAIDEWGQTDSDEAIEELIAESGSVSAKQYDVSRLRADVQSDRNLLAKFARRAKAVAIAQDPKLKSLVNDALKPLLRKAKKEASDEADLRNKRKVIIFTYYADTVEWIMDCLAEVFDQDKSLAPYRGRVAAVVGNESYQLVTREEAVFGFAPISSEAPAGRDHDLFDILVTTDVLAEGMNLQQSRNIINYDLPWNPRAAIGVIVPDLAARRAAVERAFRAVLEPTSQLPGGAPVSRLVNFSAGQPLADYPIVHSALAVLRLSADHNDWDDASALVRDRYMAGAETERTARGLLDARLRESGRTQFSLADIRDVARADCPALSRALRNWLKSNEGAPTRQTAAPWAATFSARLQAVGWPGEQPLNSIEYQTIEAWKEALSAFAGTDSAAGEMSATEALSLLTRIARGTDFQPESPDAVVQVLGTLEASGLQFDHLWVAGLDDESWPKAASPDPFLPIRLRREVGVPRCSPERELAFATQVTQRLLASAPDIVLSYQGGPDAAPTGGRVDKDLENPKDRKHSPKKQVPKIDRFRSIARRHPQFAL